MYTGTIQPDTKEEHIMKVARLVLKIVAASLAFAAAICAVIAYWDKLSELCGGAKDKLAGETACSSEYDDYEE